MDKVFTTSGTNLVSGRVLEVLMVEDSPTDVLMTREALEQAKMIINLYVVEDGVEAMSFLHKKEEYKDAPRPDIILLDLNLPRKDGREVLSEVKADDLLKIIPVVVLTTSKAEEDIVKSYGLHANCYITKPVGFAQFAEVVNSIEHFWFTIVTLPAEE
ncbi:MAG: response regulator [Blastocatellia bacterium]|nr:response regulator [Blastocatellia bacterium]